MLSVVVGADLAAEDVRKSATAGMRALAIGSRRQLGTRLARSRPMPRRAARRVRVVLRVRPDRPSGKVSAVAFNAIEPNGSCHGFHVCF